MTRDQAAVAMAEAVEAAYRAYSSACDTERRAIDPAADLDVPEGLLDEAYETALTVEGLAAERGISWAEARELV
ncbi:hypothetical protein [Roseovarius sp. D22-M7]|uniref:hypothetical protein n=1 Tax=Roseovarius sp. D22-M7 TaxID=3127116 RepID=UPI00300FAB6D